MATIPKRKIVKEQSRYDDLLDKSPLMKRLIENPKESVRRAAFKSPSEVKNKPTYTIKVHIRDLNAAQAFAQLIQQLTPVDRRPPLNIDGEL